MTVEPPLLRYTQQITATHWVTQCKVCPKRYGRKSTDTEWASNNWWTRHVQTAIHIKCAADDGKPTPEEEVIDAIFSTQERKRVPGVDRTGEVIKRPRRAPRQARDR